MIEQPVSYDVLCGRIALFLRISVKLNVSDGFHKEPRKLILSSKKINSSSILAISSTFLNDLKL